MPSMLDKKDNYGEAVQKAIQVSLIDECNGHVMVVDKSMCMDSAGSMFLLFFPKNSAGQL